MEISRHKGSILDLSLKGEQHVIGRVMRASAWSGTIVLASAFAGNDATETILARNVERFHVCELGKGAIWPPYPFRVLSNEISEAISRIGGITFLRREIFTPNTPGLEVFRDVFSCSTEWDLGSVWARVRPEDAGRGWMESEMRPLPPGVGFRGEVHFAHQVLSHAFVLGQSYERQSGAVFPKGTYLKDPQDSFEHVVRNAEEKVSVRFEFPPDGSPDVITVTRIAPGMLANADPAIHPENDRFEYVLEHPIPGEKIVFEWLNSREVIDRTLAALAADPASD